MKGETTVPNRTQNGGVRELKRTHTHCSAIRPLACSLVTFPAKCDYLHVALFEVVYLI